MTEDKQIEGRFKSPLEAYPGHIQLPSPFMLQHFKAYWNTAIKPLSDLRPIDWDYWQGPLDGVILLIADYGEWGIEGVQFGDVKAGNIPLELSQWLLGVGREYITPKLDPKLQGVVSTII
jgi:hypothetical protein